MFKEIRVLIGILLLGLLAFTYCKAECAIFDTKTYNDGISRWSMAADLFQKNGKNYFIYVYKDCIFLPNRGNYIYYYKVSIDQPVINKYIDISKIILMSESMDITLYKDENTANFSGTEVRTDMLKSFDTGRFNTVLLTTRQKLLIRIVDKNNYYYDFYATEEFIDKCKKVANWS